VKASVAASGPADPDTVWDRYVHPARWHEWSPQIVAVEYPDDTLSTGRSGTVHGPCGVAVTFEILAIDTETRWWSWRVSVAGITLDMLHSVFPVVEVGSATRTTLEITGPAPIVLGYLPIARIALGRLVR
jgi:hypothetical protein